MKINSSKHNSYPKKQHDYDVVNESKAHTITFDINHNQQQHFVCFNWIIITTTKNAYAVHV